MQRLMRAVYPPQCVMCDTRTDVDFALCGACWAQTPFIDGLCCDACGVPLPGDDVPADDLFCDYCLTTARPWSKGRAVMAYRDKGSRFVLSLKHGDRTDLARSAAPWLARAAAPMMREDTLIVPIPLHRVRLLRRRFNQSALLAQTLARITAQDYSPDTLIRPKMTASLAGQTPDQRFATLQGAITAHPKRGAMLKDRNILLVDDVMTSGATFAAATEACFAAGAADVCILSLARAVKDA